jgi:hypothetical protein
LQLATTGVVNRGAAVGPGLHLGRLTRALTGDARPRYEAALAGRALEIGLDPSVSPSFATQCLRESRPVLVGDTEHGPQMLGALQVREALEVAEGGLLAIEAEHVRIRAATSLALEVPAASLRLEPNGMRLEGERLIIDMAAFMRVFAAKVELP